MEDVTASPEQLMDQAPSTIASYLRAAEVIIDEQFGTGYAERNPVLVGAFIQSCALDYNTAIMLAAIQDHATLTKPYDPHC